MSSMTPLSALSAMIYAALHASTPGSSEKTPVLAADASWVKTQRQ
eukprot:CAMPEP_0185592842 /NCGR_PEP_ID=MMETSP0434-20130131/69427_1 /TAXON_ID=626734 ORGANISM="Favella taraikaensis, Strain Fe Narragansett Bay" /NCGR_SAMPLE_ID=MMETSP0434 /ASSEMBLY_ACC=CAM_ASM_000379 /LENGTH=44 /DNA_ID= /DNA_START= /DNA_END= /DNA_ORIENTATION=